MELTNDIQNIPFLQLGLWVFQCFTWQSLLQYTALRQFLQWRSGFPSGVVDPRQLPHPSSLENSEGLYRGGAAAGMAEGEGELVLAIALDVDVCLS